jgi:hypothetical protein
MLTFTSIVTANNQFDYLRDLSPEELDFSQLNKDEQNYIQRLMFASLDNIIPDDMQKKMINAVYSSLEEVSGVIQYCKLWQIEVEKSNLFTNIPIKIYRLVRTDLMPQRVITHVLYDELKKTYKIVGFEEIMSDRFNELVDINLGTPSEAIKYLQDFIQMTKYHTKVVDDEWLHPTYGFRSAKELSLHPPIVIFSSDEYFLIKLFVERQIEPKYTYISRIIGIVSCRGRIAFTEEVMY